MSSESNYQAALIPDVNTLLAYLSKNFITQEEHKAVVFDYENKLKLVTSRDGMANRLMELFSDRRDLQNIVDVMFESLVIAYDANIHPNSYNCDCVCCKTNTELGAVLAKYINLISPFVKRKYEQRVFGKG